MTKRAIGMMSGTSLDGVDVLLAEISGTGLGTQVQIIAARTYSYDKHLLERIKQSMDSKTCTAKLICSLNVELARYYSECVFMLCEEFRIPISSVDYIASHGQTIYHIAEAEEGYYPSSLQLGDGTVLANLTGIPAVSNFRNADIARGGQGAPLVPYVDYILFRDEQKSRILQNIGGISNSTYIPSKARMEDVMAFDNGPGNMMIDHAMQVLYGQPYDKNGDIASKGLVIVEMFEEMKQHPYYKKLPPKSTGRELFGVEYADDILKKYQAYENKDIIATLTHVSAYALGQSLKDFILPNKAIDEIIVSGGGAHNKTLIDLIKDYSGIDQVNTLEEYGFDSDYKEALAFLILGNETMEGNTSNLPSATGAFEPVILGQISPVRK